MTKDLQRRLRSLRSAERELSPESTWVAQTRASLALAVKESLPDISPKVARHQTWKALWQLIPSQFVQWVRRPVFASLAAMIGLAGGSLMSVSAAERSNPGDFFYGLKLATEQARLALTSAKDEKLKLKTEFTGRRMDELKQAVETKQTNHVVEVAEIMKRDLDTMKHQLAEVSKEETPAKAADVAKLVDKKTSEVVSALQQAKPQLSPEILSLCQTNQA
jgi:predicted transcriptional regulator